MSTVALQSFFSLPKCLVVVFGGFGFFFQIKEENREQWKPADSPEVAVGFTVCDAASCSN